MLKKKNNSYPSEMLKALPGLGRQGFENFTKKAFSRAIRLHPDKGDLIANIFNSSVISLHSMKKDQPKKLTSFTQESHLKSNLMILNDRLNSYKHGQETKSLTTLLLKILGRELISREKDSKPFWTEAYKDLSEMLWLPTKTDCQDLPSTSLKKSSPKQAGPSQSLVIQETLHPNKNLPKISSALSISTLVDKWVSAHMSDDRELMRTLIIPLKKLTSDQKKVIDRDLQTSNYKYNKAVEVINSGNKVPSKLTLRNMLVIENSRQTCSLLKKVNSRKAQIEAIVNELKIQKTVGKSGKEIRSFRSIVKACMIKEKCWKPIKTLYDSVRYFVKPIRNDMLKDFELETAKEIRESAVFEASTNYSNCCNAIKAGRIKFFQLKYRSKKKDGMSMTLTKAMLKLDKGSLRFTNRQMTNKAIVVSKRCKKDLLKIPSLKDCKMIKKFGKYYLHIPIEVVAQKPETLTKIVGIDPGISTFLSCYSPDRTIAFKQSDQCRLIDKLHFRLTDLRQKQLRKRIRRKTLCKLDLRKKNVVDELHWQSINYLVKQFDVIFIEKFDSQGFVKNGKKKGLNRNTNNLKPYLFRQRLEYKASVYGKIVKVVKAHNTTKTCSHCGDIKSMTLSDRVYDCPSCNQVLDRDFNAAKNMILKGLLC